MLVQAIRFYLNRNSSGFGPWTAGFTPQLSSTFSVLEAGVTYCRWVTSRCRSVEGPASLSNMAADGSSPGTIRLERDVPIALCVCVL